MKEKKEFLLLLRQKHVQYTTCRGQVQIGLLLLSHGVAGSSFSSDGGFLRIYTPHARSQKGIISLDLHYSDFDHLLRKLLLWHMRLFGNGFRMSGKLRQVVVSPAGKITYK